VTDLPISVSWFPTAMPTGPALGQAETLTWENFTGVFWHRREGAKDGPNFVPATFTLEPDRLHVRRQKANLLARTAVALDIEVNKVNGEVPPSISDAATLVRHLGLAAVIYSSHSHTPAAPRYRIVLQLPAQIDHQLPAPEVVAERLGLLGVLDHSKIGASSLFYLPSCEYGMEDGHETTVLDGDPLDGTWLIEAAGTLLAARQAKADRVATEAHEAAVGRREAKIAAGFDPDDSLIEKLRAKLDLDAELLAHGYEKSGTKYRHSNSSSGSYGADIAVLGGIERVFSHNGTDPLHAANLPAWCDVTAVDAFDVVCILDFGGNRRKALRELAARFNLTKAAEKKALAGLLFRMIREQASQDAIEAAAMAEGNRLGLSRDDVCATAVWVAGQAIGKAA
jgi:hypothetical protein